MKVSKFPRWMVRLERTWSVRNMLPLRTAFAFVRSSAILVVRELPAFALFYLWVVEALLLQKGRSGF
jgi:uncharacterized membrane protein YwaF